MTYSSKKKTCSNTRFILQRGGQRPERNLVTALLRVTGIVSEYDHLWVSWSKNAKNWYIEEHLYGATTHLTCHIENPQYGIDLSAFGQSRGEENEVVYPMVEANIDRAEYIERD